MGYLLPDNRRCITYFLSPADTWYQLMRKGILEAQPWFVVFKGWTLPRELHLSESSSKGTRWSGLWFSQPSWLSPNASISKFDQAGWKATCSFISLTFSASVGWKAISPSTIPEGKSKGHLVLSYRTFQTCTKLKVELALWFLQLIKLWAFCWFSIHLFYVQDSPDQGKDCQAGPAGERTMGGVQKEVPIQPHGQVPAEWHWVHDQRCWCKPRPVAVSLSYVKLREKYFMLHLSQAHVNLHLSTCRLLSL